MGPPLGHVRDPGKQYRFVEAELTALLQAAGGTLPVIKKNERGVFVMVETAAGHGHEAKPAAPKPPPATAVTEKKATPATSAAPQPAALKGEAQPDRKLMRRYTYSGVTDTGPVPGESFTQKVERLRAVAAAAKRRAEEGGGESQPVASSAASQPSTQTAPAGSVASSTGAEPASTASESQPAASTTTAATSSGSDPDRSLMKRYTYAGVVDTGPVPGETFAQKVERLRALAAAAKLRSEGG
jgi:hypothetical protein